MNISFNCVIFFSVNRLQSNAQRDQIVSVISTSSALIFSDKLFLLIICKLLSFKVYAHQIYSFCTTSMNIYGGCIIYIYLWLAIYLKACALFRSNGHHYFVLEQQICHTCSHSNKRNHKHK